MAGFMLSVSAASAAAAPVAAYSHQWRAKPLGDVSRALHGEWHISTSDVTVLTTVMRWFCPSDSDSAI